MKNDWSLPSPSYSSYFSDIFGFIFMLIFLFIIIFIIVAWIIEFLELMSFKDSQFIGKNDKVLWFIFFLVLPILAPFIFKYFKKKYYTEN